MTSSNQVKKHIPNPTGKGGFQERPQDRNSGTWNSKMVFSHQYRRFMHMTITEIEEWSKNTPKSERTVVEDLAYNRVIAAKQSLPDVKEITDRTEGKAPQSIDVTSNGETVKGALVEFIDNEPEQNKD